MRHAFPVFFSLLILATPTYAQNQRYLYRVTVAEGVTQAHNYHVKVGDTLFTLEYLSPKECTHCFEVEILTPDGKSKGLFNPLYPKNKKYLSSLSTKGYMDTDIIDSVTRLCDTIYLPIAQQLDNKYRIMWHGIDTDANNIITQPIPGYITLASTLFKGIDGPVSIDIYAILPNGIEALLFSNITVTLIGSRFLN